jgi:hypothetical protein
VLRVLASVAPIVLLDWLLITWVDPDPTTGWWESVAIGLVFGSLFGQTTLAATWSAFGPAPLIWRLPGSVIWIFMLAVGLAINTTINGGPGGGPLIVGAVLFCQWLLLQIPLWSIKWAFGVELRHVEDAAQGYDPSQRQFGIRQLMTITAIVGVALGIGRLIIPPLIAEMQLPSGDLPVFAFLVVAEVVLTLPLVLAALLHRFAIGGVLVAVVFVAVVTFGEVPLMQLLSAGPGPQTMDFVALNAVASALILLVLSVVRLSGYSLATIQKTSA